MWKNDKSKLKKEITSSIRLNLARLYGVTPATASKNQMFVAVCNTVRDELMDQLTINQERDSIEPKKKLYYLSVEFLQGRALSNSLLNLDQTGVYRETLEELGFSLNELEELELDPGLGNGGLGRLASCFLDSLATLNYRAMGCGIRYEYGLFRQRIIDNEQIEAPDSWLDEYEGSYPWEVMMPGDAVDIKFEGNIWEDWQSDGLHVHHSNYKVVRAVPYDIPIMGYKSNNVCRLRLWRAVAPKRLDMESFSRGQYTQAYEERELAEVISKVLYPNEGHMEGKSLRLKQHYFFTSATMQYIVKEYKRQFGKDLTRLDEKVAIQINDTHPALAIPELMRILMDEEGYGWDQAWNIVTGVFNYTNHTVMSEALEKWPEQLFRDLLPRIYSIVVAINEKFCKKLQNYFPGDSVRIGNMAIIGYNEVRMANLCIAASAHVNGVSKLHADILQQDVFQDFYIVEPWKFSGITNGITPRRWLMSANPKLSSLLDESIGESWRSDLMQLDSLMSFRDNASFQEKFDRIKYENKVSLSNWLKDKQGVSVDPNMIFDSQAKRLHEYKRQLLNILNVIYYYDRLMSDSSFDMPPTVFFFGAKAAANYHIAKQTIRLINTVAEKIDRAPEHVREKLKVVFIENYNVTAAEMLIPATDISEQLSTAGKEASGTGNMKFMINGAVTIGTLDGANVEIADAVGNDNIYIFGLTAQEVESFARSNLYLASQTYESNPAIRRVIDYLVNGKLDSDNKEHRFGDLYRGLLFDLNGQRADPYFVLKDFCDYSKTHANALNDYQNRGIWLQKSITNTAKSGIFSSDRTIEEYNRTIWRLDPLN